MSRSIWTLAPRAPAAFVSAMSPIHPLTAQVLYARGYTTPESAWQFLEANHPLPIQSLTDLDHAVTRVLHAITTQEPIAIYGDYDVDGVTACALLSEALQALGGNVRTYIPNRFEEGYGLNRAALDTLHAEGIRLVITVDCGARAIDEAQHARDIGLDLIITDHHELQDGCVPPAYAVINPQRESEGQAPREIAGVGVAFLLAQALLKAAGQSGMSQHQVESAQWLDLVALGTVADAVPLQGLNRRWVRDGLRQISHHTRPGLRALIDVSGLTVGKVLTEQVGFALAPRLNAAGRLESAYHALKLLIAREADEATTIARWLDQHNRQRQDITLQVLEDAQRRALAEGNDSPLLFAAANYHIGVVGLAAQRLVDWHYRPAVVIGVEDGIGRGSCRSVAGFHITRALDECRDLLIKHGGHAMAAGFSVRAADIPLLKTCLMTVAARERPAQGWQRHFHADAELDAATLRDCAALDGEAMRSLACLQPHGMANPRPLFWLRHLTVQRASTFGNHPREKHLRLTVRDKQRATWDIKGWRMGTRLAEIHEGMQLEALVHLDVNTWNGVSRLELQLVDFRPASAVE